MSMNRFFLSPDLIQKDSVTFPKEIAHQISRVLRLEEGKRVQVLDGFGQEYLIELTQVEPSIVGGRVISSSLALGEPKTRIHLLVALTQREKFEWILQKCTEVGVASFTPIVTSRSLVQKTMEMEGKYPRWHKIIQEAAEQSHRGVIPMLNPVISYHQLMTTKLTTGISGLFFWEEERQIDLKIALADMTNRDINLFVGPEGGFTPEEADQAKEAGYVSVSLGKRILRLETAAVIAPALVLYQME
jgi:16S rRNA (uracil1498-N3)-methyltransferase